MYCEKCGAEIKEGQKFCGNCGAPVKGLSGQTSRQTQEQVPEDEIQTNFSEEEPEKRQIPLMGIVITVIVIAVIFIAACVFLFTSKYSPFRTTIDLNDYTTVEFDGYNGYGSASVSLNYDEIVSDYGSKVKVQTEGSASFKSIISEHISASLDDTEGLSDGDTVTVSFTVDEANLDEALNCNFTYEDKSYTVEGLKEVQDVDVFEGVDISYDGMAPFGRASLKIGASETGYGDYEVNPDSGLSNGDEVTVTYEVTDTAGFLNAYDGLPSVTEKKFTVSGLDSYVMDIKELSEENYNTLKEDALNQAKARAGSLSSSDIRNMLPSPEGGRLTPIGSSLSSDYTLDNVYFLTIKDSTDKDREQNNIEVGVPVFVYSVDAHIDAMYGYTADGPIYISVNYPHLVLKEDGTLTGLDESDTYTYTSLEDVYNGWLESNAENYNIVVYDGDLNETD